MKYHATMAARSTTEPSIVSAVRQGKATVTMAAAAHANAAASHAGRASASEERTRAHWSLMARTTKTPAAAAMTAPTAVESQATRFFLSGCSSERGPDCTQASRRFGSVARGPCAFGLRRPQPEASVDPPRRSEFATVGQ
jgi:hypothetical protein